MKTVLLRIVLALAALLALNGCATIAVMQLRGKLPQVEAEELAVKLRWAGVQVGILETTGLHYDEKGKLVAVTFHEDVGTPTGGIEITGKNVKIPSSK